MEPVKKQMGRPPLDRPKRDLPVSATMTAEERAYLDRIVAHIGGRTSRNEVINLAVVEYGKMLGVE